VPAVIKALRRGEGSVTAIPDLHAHAFVAAEMIDSATATMVEVRDEVANQLAALADDWTPTRTLGPNERDLIAFAGQMLAGRRLVMAVR
jgi:hypothetical protein